MKELIKSGAEFQIVESGKVMFSTDSGPQMVEWIRKQPNIIIQLRTAEPWTDKVKEPEM